ELEQRRHALGRGGLLPRLEGLRGRVRRSIDILCVGGRHAGNDLAVGWVLDLERLAAGAVDPLAADELLEGLHPLHEVGHWVSPPGVAAGPSPDCRRISRGWRRQDARFVGYGHHSRAPSGPGPATTSRLARVRR